VRSIRIRATEIETLDNQNVLLPNSELISGRVTNWVLRDTAGRLQVFIGVAYGSDVELVRDILESVGYEHPEVISDGSAPAPRALFMGFGDSSLNFELRVRVYRIDRRFSVLSDLNFKIDAAFREAGISIPFPQRDLHIISRPGEAASEATTREKAAVPRTSSAAASTLTRQHEEAVDIRASQDEVWDALVDIDTLHQWLIKDGRLTPRIGGHFSLTARNDQLLQGYIDVLIPRHRLRFVLATREGMPSLPAGPITVLFRVQGIEGGTRLTVTVAGVPATEDWEQDYIRSETMWENALQELKKLLEGAKR
jgi:uncharacterized protein YndB with AHSA1/START domain